MWETRATGISRVARAAVAAEFAAVVLAIGWTVAYIADPARSPGILLQVLDVFWPLSMLGTLVVGALVARAGRWPSPWRFLPLSAGLLLVVDISILCAPDAVRSAVAASYILVTYGVVGLSVAVGSTRLATISGPQASESRAITRRLRQREQSHDVTSDEPL